MDPQEDDGQETDNEGGPEIVGMNGPPSGLIQAMMSDMLQNMGGPIQGGQVTITQTPGGVSMRIGGPIGGGIPPPNQI